MRRAGVAPALSAAEVSERIGAIVRHEEFWFDRLAQSVDLDWILGAPDDGYEMFCTACGQRFFEKRDRKHTVTRRQGGARFGWAMFCMSCAIISTSLTGWA